MAKPTKIVCTIASMRSGSSWLHNVVKCVAARAYGENVHFHKSHVYDNNVKSLIRQGAIVVSSVRDDPDAVIDSFLTASRFRGPSKENVYNSGRFRKSVTDSIAGCKAVPADLRVDYDEVTNDPVGCVRKVLKLFGQDESMAYGIAYRFRKDACPDWYTAGHIATEGTDRHLFVESP